jgi:hypothetical protein
MDQHYVVVVNGKGSNALAGMRGISTKGRFSYLEAAARGQVVMPLRA